MIEEKRFGRYVAVRVAEYAGGGWAVCCGETGEDLGGRFPSLQACYEHIHTLLPGSYEERMLEMFGDDFLNGNYKQLLREVANER